MNTVSHWNGYRRRLRHTVCYQRTFFNSHNYRDDILLLEYGFVPVKYNDVDYTSYRSVHFLFPVLKAYQPCSVYPRQAWRLMQDPVKGIFVPLVVCSLQLTVFYVLTPYTIGFVFRHDHNRHHKLRLSNGTC